MSQYVKVQCEVLDDVRPSLFRELIQHLDGGIYDLNENLKQVKAYGGITGDVDCVLTKKGEPLSIGFKFTPVKAQDGTVKRKLEIRGDFWMTGLTEEKFANTIRQQYQVMHLTRVVHQNQVTQKPVVRKDGKIVFRVAA